MVNRVLIRIKVVQMLYSYLLTRSEFKINDAPETASRDARYAHAVYIDMLLLLLELSGYSVKNGEKAPKLAITSALATNKAAKALSINDAIRSAILRGNNHINAFDPLLQNLIYKIEESAVYKDYQKKKTRELADDVTMWTAIFETVIARDNDVKEALRKEGDFTNQGFLSGIRDLCLTLKSYADSRQFYLKAKEDLAKSLDKAYELYLSIFALIMDITREQERRLDTAKSKHLATSDDLNPNTSLVDNKFVEYLSSHEQLASLMKEYGVKREEITTPLIKGLLDQILESDLYREFCQLDKHDLHTDAEFWRDALRTIVFTSDDFLESMEDKSVFWNDDLQTMGTFVLKTIRQIAQSDGQTIEMLPHFKNVEDEKFGPDLFRYAVENQDEYRKIIDMHIESSHWDPERLAYMDIVIMTTAIAEIINYPAIPAPVSVNEYVEIANNYSTEKSGGFINGILYSIVAYLNAQGIINKK